MTRCCLTDRELAELVSTTTGEPCTAVRVRRWFEGDRRSDPSGHVLTESSLDDGVVTRCSCDRRGWRLTRNAYDVFGGPLRDVAGASADREPVAA